jgi:AcrR family transcriptional regulator
MRGTGTPATGPSRRRGAVLEEAILDATVRELSATGYSGLTMDGVARRAGTGKAALYRRWPSKRDMVLDALARTVVEGDVAPSDSVRDDLLGALVVMADALGRRGGGPGLDVLMQVLGEPELRTAFATRVIEPRMRRLRQVVRRATGRRPDAPGPAVTALIARAGPALVLQTFLLTGRPPARAELFRIVDAILLPLLDAPRPPPRPR